MRGVTGLVIAVVVLAGCSSDDENRAPPRASQDQCQQACDHMIGCGSTTTDCVGGCLGQNWSSACANAIVKATCDDVKSSEPTFFDTCFPPCSGETYKCIGQGEIQTCDAGHLYTFDCSYVCEKSGKTYVGSCGTTYNGQTSSSGHAVCWCSS